ILTVFGWDDRPAQVHNEGTSLIGPKVVVDQLHNIAVIEGRGSVAMVTASDLTGSELKQPEVVVIHFRDGMIFEGAKKKADFFGKVNASQGASWVTCHTMQVIFDRPIYFSQMNRPAPPPKPANPPAKGAVAKGPNGQPDEEKAKVDKVLCWPAPADAADSLAERLVSFFQVDRDPDTGKLVRQQKLVARQLMLQAQARDESSPEPYTRVVADGPGEVRIWQLSNKDDDGPAGSTAPAPRQPGNVAPPPPEQEMKLTIVNFS